MALVVVTPLGEHIQQLMHDQGISLRRLAKLVSYDVGYLSKVVNGRRPLAAHLAAELDRVLGANGVIIAFATPALPDATELHQLELLRRGLGDVLAEGAMAEASVDDWERAVLRHGRATRDRPAGQLYADLIVDLAELKRALSRCRTASALRRLTRVTAQMSGLMCLTLVRMDKRTASRRWARTARIAAQEASDPVTESWVLAQEAYGYFYRGELSDAIDVARLAQEIAGEIVCVGAPLAAALEARAHAALGHRADARRLLASAEDIVAHLDATSLVPSAFGYNEAQLRFHAGNAFTLLAQAGDDHRRATRDALLAQERALELCAPGDYTDWALTRLDRVSCLVGDGDLRGGMTYMTETLADLTEQQRQGLVTLRGHEIVNSLPQQQRTLPIVRDLHDLLMQTTETPEEAVPWPS